MFALFSKISLTSGCLELPDHEHDLSRLSLLELLNHQPRHKCPIAEGDSLQPLAPNFRLLCPQCLHTQWDVVDDAGAHEDVCWKNDTARRSALKGGSTAGAGGAFHDLIPRSLNGASVIPPWPFCIPPLPTGSGPEDARCLHKVRDAER